MRWRGNVCRIPCEARLYKTDVSAVFRAAHDSSKAIRIWMGEMKKS